MQGRNDALRAAGTTGNKKRVIRHKTAPYVLLVTHVEMIWILEQRYPRDLGLGITTASFINAV